MTGDPWKDVSAARMPAAHLDVLAPLRADADVRVQLIGELAWVRWSAGRDAVVRRLLLAPGVAFFTRREALWFRFGSRLPTSDVPPASDGQPLARVLIPERFEPLPPNDVLDATLPLRIVRGGEPQRATALLCTIADLEVWSDSATTAELAAVSAVRSGNRVVLLGAKLPTIAEAIRFWGEALLVPVGFRAEPDLPTAAIRAACGASEGELVLLLEDGAELIPRAAFEPMTRAGLRLALREAP